jgi:arylsulfatase
MHEMKYFNFLVETPDEAVERIDDIGGPHSHANYPWGWAQAGNTPFKWYKQNTHEGGVHVPLIMRWPGHITDGGATRDQFHHVDDIAPTIYEALGVTPPDVYRGYEQIPLSGVSMHYTFDQPEAASAKRMQYYEMMGHRALYADGWKAVTRHQAGTPFEEDDWELYNLAEDRSECHNLAAAMPAKVAELVDRWWEQAEEYGVLPLDDRTIELFGTRYRPNSPHRPDRHYSYFPPMSPLPAQVAPALGGRGWEMAATIDRPKGAGGVLYASGTENSGVSLFIQNDHLVLDYNCFGDHHVVESATAVPTGEAVVGARFRRTGTGASATLVIDGHDSGTMDVPFAMTIISSVGPSIGYDHGSPVSPRYVGHFPFEGTLSRLDVTLVGQGPAQEVAEAEATGRAAMGRQ